MVVRPAAWQPNTWLVIYTAMAFFFATADDLLEMLLRIESKHAVSYTPFTQIHEPKLAHFGTARDIPTLFQPQVFESAVNGPSYLITESAAEVNLRQLPPFEGKNRWSVDQLANPDSVVLRHGGLLATNILLQGEVRTVSKTTVAQRLQRAFDAAIRKCFARVHAFYVGPQAEALLDSGCRLTADVHSPPEYDLRRQDYR